MRCQSHAPDKAKGPTPTANIAQVHQYYKETYDNQLPYCKQKRKYSVGPLSRLRNKIAY